MRTTENIIDADEFCESTLPRWRGNRAKLTNGNHSPVVPLDSTHEPDYTCERGWVCLGWCMAPWESKTYCPTCIVFEHEDGRLLWAHCTPDICVSNSGGAPSSKCGTTHRKHGQCPEEKEKPSTIDSDV